MATVKVYHYRDHKHGGYFNGQYINTGYAPYNVSGQTFRWFGKFIYNESLQSLWGSGVGASEFSLKTYYSSDMYLRLTFLGVDYNIGFKIEDFRNKFNIIVRPLTSGVNVVQFYVYVYDEYGNSIYYEAISLSSTGGYGSNPIFVGATSSSPLIAGQRFAGYCYAFETKHSTGNQTLLFYEGASSTTVYDYSGTRNGTVVGTLNDFWASEIDISDYYKADQSLKFSTDSMGTQQFNSTQFTLQNYDDVNIGDTIIFEIDGEKNWIFNVVKVQTKSFNKYKIICEDPLKQSENINTYRFGEFSPFRTAIVHDDVFWLNAHIPNIVNGYNREYYESSSHPTWFNIFYIFAMTYSALMYDELVSVNQSTASGTSSYYISRFSAYAKLGQITFNADIFKRIGTKENTEIYDTNIGIGDVVRNIQLVLGIKYYYDDGAIKITSDYDTHYTPSFTNEVTEEEVYHLEYYGAKCDILKSATYDQPDTTAYSGVFTSSDFTTMEANERPDNYTAGSQNAVKEITLPVSFWISYHWTTNTNNYFLNDSGLGDNFMIQFSRYINGRKHGIFSERLVSSPMFSDFSGKFIRKEDNIKNKTTKFKTRSRL